MANIREADLPGIGKKYQVETAQGENLVIIIHDDGKRELYHFDEEMDEPLSSVTLTDQEARQVGAIIEGAFYQPQALEKSEVLLEGLAIEWIKIMPGSPIIDKTIGELELRKKHAVSIIAVITEDDIHCANETKINPGPDFMFKVKQKIIAVGRRAHVDKFEKKVKGEC